jgi:hypothetical protein
MEMRKGGYQIYLDDELDIRIKDEQGKIRMLH